MINQTRTNTKKHDKLSHKNDRTVISLSYEQSLIFFVIISVANKALNV